MPSGAGTFTLLMCLDDSGLSMKNFQHLFVVCKACSDWVGTPSALEKYYCSKCQVTDTVMDKKIESSFIDLNWDWSD